MQVVQGGFELNGKTVHVGFFLLEKKKTFLSLICKRFRVHFIEQETQFDYKHFAKN